RSSDPEPPDVQRDVVVDQEDRPRSVIARVADVSQDAVEGEGMEVAPAHLDDRAKAANESTAARGFHDVDLTPQKLVAAQNASVALRRPDLAVGEAVDRTVGIFVEGARRPGRNAGGLVG